MSTNPVALTIIEGTLHNEQRDKHAPGITIKKIKCTTVTDK